MVRTGRSYLDAFERSSLEVWYGGERVRPSRVTAFERQARIIADYYDHHYRDSETNIVGSGPEAYSVTLLPPTSRENLVRKAEGFYSIAKNYLGFLGRPPDYINVVLSAWEAQSEAFGEHARSLRDYVAEVRRHDWFVTHSTSELKGGVRAGIHIVSESAEGVIIAGARAMATSVAFSDELLIAPTRLTDADSGKAIICAIPTTTRGLKLICRRNFEGSSELANSYDEMDAMIVLENVLVPWSRVFACHSLQRYHGIVKQTGTSLACSLQTNARAIAKLESIVALLRAWRKIYPQFTAHRLTQTSGTVLRDLQILKSLQAEALQRSALRGTCWQPHDESIEAAKFYFMERYPKIVSNLRQDLGPELFFLFRSQDLDDSVRDELCSQWGIDRIALETRQFVASIFHDLLAANFGVRQDLYEQFYAGNPLTGIANYWNAYSERHAEQEVFAKLTRVPERLVRSHEPEAITTL